MKICLKKHPPELTVGKGHMSACWLNVKQADEAGCLELDESGSPVSAPLDEEGEGCK
jgi:hypothetical protein